MVHKPQTCSLCFLTAVITFQSCLLHSLQRQHLVPYLEASTEASIGNPDIHRAHEGGGCICQPIHLGRAADITVHSRHPAVRPYLHQHDSEVPQELGLKMMVRRVHTVKEGKSKEE